MTSIDANLTADSWCKRESNNTVLSIYLLIIIIIIKMTSLAPISSENPSSVAQQNQRIRHSRDRVQCKKSSTDGWRCQVAKEERQF